MYAALSDLELAVKLLQLRFKVDLDVLHLVIHVFEAPVRAERRVCVCMCVCAALRRPCRCESAHLQYSCVKALLRRC